MIKRKLVIIGDGGSGKTSLLMAYKDKVFPEYYVPTVFETYATTVVWKQEEITLELWDTAGQEDYDRLRPLSYANADIVLICYSVDCVDSVINVREKWAKEVNHFCFNIPIILVATKIDLRNDNRASNPRFNADVFVSKSDGRKLADVIGADDFMECSAKNFTHVTEIFEKAVELTIPKRKPRLKLCYLF